MNKFTELYQRYCATVFPYSAKYLFPDDVDEIRRRLTNLAEEYKDYLQSYNVYIYVWESMPEDHKELYIRHGMEERMRCHTLLELSYVEKPEFTDYRHEEERELYTELLMMSEPPVFTSTKEKFSILYKHLLNIYYVYSKEDPIEKQIDDINAYIDLVFEKLGGRDIIPHFRARSLWDCLEEDEQEVYMLLGRKEEYMNTVSFSVFADLRNA